MTKWSYPRNMKSGSTFENQGQKMAQLMKVLMAKPEERSSLPGSHVVEG